MTDGVPPAEERAPLTPPESSGMAPRTGDRGAAYVEARLEECAREIAAVLDCAPEQVRVRLHDSFARGR